MAGLFTLPNYRLLLPSYFPLPNFPTYWLLGTGFILLVALWRIADPVEENQWDLSPWVAKFWFVLFMALGAWLRLKDAGRPTAGFWDDHAWIITDIRDVIDCGARPLLFPFGWREPLFPYLSAFFWIIQPKATGVFITHLSSAVIDLAALWALYLAAKEIGGRRMGLLVLAMGAISKAMIEVCVFGYGCDTTVLACSLALLFFLRLMKKPDWKHFLYWGLALGFGATCYVPFRIWTPAMLGCGWLWVYSDPRERSGNPFRLILGWGGMAALVLLFGVTNSFLPDENPLIKFVSNPIVIILAALLLAFSAYQTHRQARQGKDRKLLAWALGALAAVLVMTPFFLHPFYSSHVSDLSVFSKKLPPVPGGGWYYFWNNIVFSLAIMFGHGFGLTQCPGAGDCFFDFYVPACGILALAYFIARPTGAKLLVLFMSAVSLLPFLLSNAPHTFRLVGTDAPLLLIGAWGLNRLWLAFIQIGSRKVGGMTCAILLLALGGWELDRNTALIADWQSQKGPSAILDEQVSREIPGHKVYLFPFADFWTYGQSILCDGEEIYRVNTTIPVVLRQDEKGEDLALFLAGKDLKTKMELDKEFPGLTWNEKSTPYSIPFMRWTEIPIDRITEGQKGLVQMRRFPRFSWLRRCYRTYGVGRGMILYEDRVNHWNDDFDLIPVDAKADYNSMRLEGDWYVTREGEYSFGLRTANTTWMILDGNKILRVRGGFGDNVPKKATVFLKAGIHHVEIVTAFMIETRVPVVSVTAPGANGGVPLDECSLSAAP
jgi:hypothetical protein